MFSFLLAFALTWTSAHAQTNVPAGCVRFEQAEVQQWATELKVSGQDIQHLAFKKSLTTQLALTLEEQKATTAEAKQFTTSEKSFRNIWAAAQLPPRRI